MSLSRSLSLVLVLLASSPAVVASEPVPPLSWSRFDEQVFVRARAEKKLVLLDLGAVWCHWCHVMETTTYGDPAVARLLAERFVTVRADHEARPDLAARYQDYGWPATILFDANGLELAKRRGYIPPPAMLSMLQAFVDDPTPGPSVSVAGPPRFEKTVSATGLSPELRAELETIHRERFDAEQGSWGTGHKFLDWDGVEYCIERARAGDAEAGSMAEKTLDAERALLDPAWGGVYQYSTGGTWKEPHFEKLVRVQAENMRVYALAFLVFGRSQDREMAIAIHRYLADFLKSPDGAFYVSQDADVIPGAPSADYFALSSADRRSRGIPRVDTHLYARENGWVIQALAALHAATGDPAYRDEAIGAANWVLKNRARPDGGFRHDAGRKGAIFLGDTLAMGKAFAELYTITADRIWLRRAELAARFISIHFRASRFDPAAAGFASVGVAARRGRPHGRAANPPFVERDENVQTARFAQTLLDQTDRPIYGRMAREAFRFLSAPGVARAGPAASVLLVDRERSSEPIHVTVVGRRSDPASIGLFEAALTAPTLRKRVELWDRTKEKPIRADVGFPELDRPAAFLCAEGSCSAPLFSAIEVRRRLSELRQPARALGRGEL